MFYNRYLCPHTGKRYLWLGGDTHEEAQERAGMEAGRFLLKHLGTFAMRWPVAA